MIKFRCSGCSKKIGVPAEYATKRIRCPRCKDVLVIPALELELEPVGAIEPAAVIEPPVSQGVMAKSESDDQDELEPASPDETIWTDEMLASSVSAMATTQDKDVVHCDNCSVIVVDGETCQMCGHPVQKEVQSELSSLPDSNAYSNDQQAPQKTSFIKDLGRFLTPIRDFSDGVTFVMILLLSLFINYPIVFPFVGIAKIMAGGIVCSFMINVMLETANGNGHLPSPANLPETWTEIIRPYYQLLISVFYAFLPGIIVFLIYYITSGAEEIGPVGKKVILGAMLSCLFFWPMIILVIALRDSFFIRPDKLVVSILRTFIPYIICCACLYAAVAAMFLSIAMYASKGQGGLIVAAITAQVGGLSIQIYAMRVMGLLYRYYGDRLDW